MKSLRMIELIVSGDKDANKENEEDQFKDSKMAIAMRDEVNQHN